MVKTASLLRRALRGFILGRYRGSSLDPVRIRLPYSGELPVKCCVACWAAKPKVSKTMPKRRIGCSDMTSMLRCAVWSE